MAVNTGGRVRAVKSELFDFGKVLLLDGAMGTVLQSRGLPPGGVPELLNFERPELLREIHREYIAAGSEVIYANTFGANALKLARTGESAERVITAGVRLAKEAAAGTPVRVALDIGPLGELLEPLGTLTFERAYELFREVAAAGE
ncbi:MAG: homocysteine S-methyltransferase family protein, partial [Oscillospiraceae bacterium]|nr:homocysteine S-methyltransferase family protein [Oscillospiraceae bacterium]